MIFSIKPNYAQDLTIDRYNLVDGNTFVNNISIDEDNYLWICTTNGIKKIGNIESAPQEILSGKNIITVAHDNRLGTFATDGQRIFSIQDNETFVLEGRDIKINDIDVIRGRVYTATNQGLHILNPSTGRIEILNTKNSKMKSDHINFIHMDDKKVIWLGTISGEVRIEGDKWKTYHTKLDVTDYYENKEGMWFVGEKDMWLVDYFNREYNAGLNSELYAGSLNDFAIDSKGRLYVASNKLVRYDPYNEEIKMYSEDAGLISKKCTSIACDKNDNVWIGTAGSGLYRLVFGDAAIAAFNATILIDDNISCKSASDATLSVSVSGGQQPYSYKWDDASTSKKRRKLSAGKYIVTVTDAIQNEQVASIELTDPSVISVDLLNTTRISAPGARDGSINITASGGTGELSYRWSNGNKGATSRKLDAGEYTVTVTDMNRCSAIATFTVEKEKFIPELDISTIEVGQTLRINELYFKADSSAVTDQSYDVLSEVLAFLKENQSVVVEIGGHTNTIPSDAYCDKLSTERARAVAEYFYENDISSKRLSYKGYGKRQPITQDESLAGRRKNQRVEIKILEI